MKAFLDKLSTPLEWTAKIVGTYPKGALIVWVISLVIVARVF